MKKKVIKYENIKKDNKSLDFVLYKNKINC